MKQFDHRIAIDMGIEEAIVFQYLIESIYHAKCKPTPDSMEYGDKFWIRRPVSKIQKDLPYFSVKRIQLALLRLFEFGYLDRKVLKKRQYDTSFWFSIGGDR